MALQTIITEIYEKQEDGSFIVRTEEQVVDIPTTEELVAQKQEELIRIYNEIQALLGTQSNG